MKPTVDEHNIALNACQQIRESGMSAEYDAELCIFNAVATAYVANEKCEFSRSEFGIALERVQAEN